MRSSGRHLAAAAIFFVGTVQAVHAGETENNNESLRLAALEQAITGGVATPRTSDTQVAVTCFKTGEQVSGMNKICFYDCLGSAAAITISSVKLCPLTINR